MVKEDLTVASAGLKGDLSVLGQMVGGKLAEAIASKLGRRVGAGDASIIGGAIKNGTTVITRDKRMSEFMKAGGAPFKTF